MSTRPRLESMLTSLAGSIDWPAPSPHMTGRVMARIESELTAQDRRGWRRPVIALVAALIVSLVMVLSPSAREAVAGLLSAAGVRIGVTSDQAPFTGSGLNLGERVQLNEAKDSVDFELRIPSGEDPGAPDAVYLSATGQVTMVWAGNPTLPAAGETGIGLLFTQGKANGGQGVAEKSIGPATGVESLSVEGQPALWIEGAAHVFTLLDAEGDPIEETTRLAANVLLWDANGVSHRLETTRDLKSALALVEALRPLP